ncbi:hypothetical protein V5799_030346 [Amblyomma americanum]|uniref:Major facilitator superfamily (MFS) profile domain-containing protein n=1 Tax=Amblyomma americanum TaxID=6943 RepID=A0AAQ4ENL0_AMBAM
MAVTPPSPGLSRLTRSGSWVDVVMVELGAPAEDGLHAVMGHGLFQHRLLLHASLSLAVLLCHALAFRLIARDVDHWCRPPRDVASFPTAAAWKNAAIPVVGPDGAFSRCTMYDPPVQVHPHTKRLIVPCDEWEYDEEHGRESIVAEWNLVCGRAWLLHLATVLYTCGALMVAPLSGFLADRHGRATLIMLSTGVLAISSFGSAFSRSFLFFVVVRFFVSAASGTLQVVSFVLLYEFTFQSRRILYSLLAMLLGPLAVPCVYQLLELARLGWVAVQVVFMAPTVLLALSCYYVKESPSWLLVTWEMHRAEAVTLHVAGVNGIPMDTAKHLFKRVKSNIKKREDAPPPSPALTLTPPSYPGLVLLLTESAFRRRALPTLFCWFAVTFSFYSTVLHGAAADSRTPWESAACVAMAVPFCASYYYFITRHGLRHTLTVLLALLGWVTALLALSTSKGHVTLKAIISAAVKCGSILALSTTYVYAAEIFPTVPRCLGVSASYSCGLLGSLLSTFLLQASGPAVSPDTPLAVLVAMATLLFLCCVALQALPEIRVETDPGPPEPMDEAGRKRALQESLGQSWSPGARSFDLDTTDTSSHSKGKRRSKVHSNVTSMASSPGSPSTSSPVDKSPRPDSSWSPASPSSLRGSLTTPVDSRSGSSPDQRQ